MECLKTLSVEGPRRPIHWPEHVPIHTRVQTVEDVRANTVNTMAKRILLSSWTTEAGDFEFNHSQLKAILYEGVRRIMRLPSNVDHFLQTKIAFSDTAFVVAREHDLEARFKAAAETVDVYTLMSSQQIAQREEKYKKYKLSVDKAINQALGGVLEKLEKFPDEDVREIIRQCRNGRRDKLPQEEKPTLAEMYYSMVEKIEASLSLKDPTQQSQARCEAGELASSILLSFEDRPLNEQNEFYGIWRLGKRDDELAEGMFFYISGNNAKILKAICDIVSNTNVVPDTNNVKRFFKGFTFSASSDLSKIPYIG